MKNERRERRRERSRAQLQKIAELTNPKLDLEALDFRAARQKLKGKKLNWCGHQCCRDSSFCLLGDY